MLTPGDLVRARPPDPPARLAAWFAKNPLWLSVQRWLMAGVLGALAVRLAIDGRRN